MKLIVGLGNPGEKYAKTRHNVGFMFVDSLAAKWEAAGFQMKKKFDSEVTDVTLKGEKYILAKPQTYMNNSGRAVSALANFYSIYPDDVVVIHDDLDIALGEYKVHYARGPKVHNGLISIQENLGTDQFTRVRIGVDARTSEERMSGHDYVLSNFSQSELEIVHTLFPTISDEIRND